RGHRGRQAVRGGRGYTLQCKVCLSSSMAVKKVGKEGGGRPFDGAQGRLIGTEDDRGAPAAVAAGSHDEHRTVLRRRSRSE
ncbi:MAG: hypothetical protein ACYTBJ_19670, partial [Planctomycetota bacterium]